MATFLPDDAEHSVTTTPDDIDGAYVHHRDSSGVEVIRNRQGLPPDPRISIIIPTWNRAQVLREAVLALQMQTMRDFELIVVDNGPSTDATREIMLAFVAEDPRIIYMATSRKGDFIARNIGCTHARCDILLTIDDDWEMTDPASLDYILEQFARDGKLGVLGLGHDHGAELNSHPAWKKALYRMIALLYRPGCVTRWGRVTTRLYYLPFGTARDVDHVKGACMAFRREPSQRVAFFPEFYVLNGVGYRAETDLCLLIKRQGYRVVFSTERTGLHKAAPRGASLQARARNVSSVYQWSRNNMLCTLRHFWSPRSAWAFLAYDVLVGNANQPGALRVILNRRHFMRFPIIISSVKGKIAGFRAYRDPAFRRTI